MSENRPMSPRMSPRAELPAFLADTWWFGLTGRLGDEAFRRLVALRASQGFTAAQLVVGIPPEVGPAHPAAGSPVGSRRPCRRRARSSSCRERAGPGSRPRTRYPLGAAGDRRAAPAL
jgi:hypothetical protein